MEMARKKYLLNNPEKVSPKEFNYKFLDQIFCHRFGYGGSKFKMKIGGIEFTKTIKPVFSNSMKNKTFAITITGGDYSFERPSDYADNKRNRSKQR